MGAQQEVGIIYGDLTQLARFGLGKSDKVYCDVINATRTSVMKSTERYVDKSKLVLSLRGGLVDAEFRAIVATDNPEDTKTHTLRLAMTLRRDWRRTKVGRDLTSFSKLEFGYNVALSMGVVFGKLSPSMDPWTETEQLEGSLVGYVRDVQSLAEALSPESLILVTGDIQRAAQRTKLARYFEPQAVILTQKQRKLLDPIYEEVPSFYAVRPRH